MVAPFFYISINACRHYNQRHSAIYNKLNSLIDKSYQTKGAGVATLVYVTFSGFRITPFNFLISLYNQLFPLQ